MASDRRPNLTMNEETEISTAVEYKQAGLLFSGAVALLLICVTIVGIDYSEVRRHAATVPLNSQRITSVEEAMRDGARAQADATHAQAKATKELSLTVADLRVAIAELKSSRDK